MNFQAGKCRYLIASAASQMLEDVARHNLSSFYANMECIAYLNRLYTSTKMHSVSEHFVILHLPMPILRKQLHQSESGCLICRLN